MSKQGAQMCANALHERARGVAAAEGGGGSCVARSATHLAPRDGARSTQVLAHFQQRRRRVARGHALRRPHAALQQRTACAS
jgi:hypothetical protein